MALRRTNHGSAIRAIIDYLQVPELTLKISDAGPLGAMFRAAGLMFEALLSMFRRVGSMFGFPGREILHPPV